MKIAGRSIGPGDPCFIIAEVGINHGGQRRVCETMMRAAHAAGADAIKLQTVTPDESYHPDTESYSVFKDSVFGEADLRALMALAETLGIVLFSTPGDPKALELMLKVGMPAIKISSGLLTNLPLIRLAATSGKPLIMSTGMAYAREVDDAIGAALATGNNNIAVLQCTSLYPAPAESLNLSAIENLRSHTGVPVGYSDHHDGSLACVAAVAMGANLIEKHFTMDKSIAGADHAISLEPADFGRMVSEVRSVEMMRGSGTKEPSGEEIPLRDGRHRRLVAARDLPVGHILQADDLYLMRLPGAEPGLPAMRLDEVIGQATTRHVAFLTGITADVVEGIE